MRSWRAIGFSLAAVVSFLTALKGAWQGWQFFAAIFWLVFLGLVVWYRFLMTKNKQLLWRIELEKRLQGLRDLNRGVSRDEDQTLAASDESLFSAEERPAARRLIRDLDVGHFAGLFPFFISKEGRRFFLRFLTLPLKAGAEGLAEIQRRQAAVLFWERHSVLRRRILRSAVMIEQEIDSQDLLVKTAEANAKEGSKVWFYAVTALQFTFFILWAVGLSMGTKALGLVGLMGLAIGYYLALRNVDLFSSYPRAMAIGRSLRSLKEVGFVLQKVAHLPAAQASSFQEDQAPMKLMAEVEKAAGALGVRQNPLLALLINFLIPWDLYWTLRFDRARQVVSERLPAWLNTLAEVEAFIVGAEWNTAHGKSLPRFGAGEAGGYVEAKALAHPLLDPRIRVANSFRIDRQARCHLITGSNMSGKSTFLRSVGLNILIAHAGLKVVAERLDLSLLQLESSLRPSDSLADGFSSFYSEVSDLVEILRDAKEGRPVFYLIDEIFRGTNNRERRIGAESVIRSFLKTDARGIVTTHDLDLAALEGEVQGLSNHHFRDEVIDGKMAFSYEYRNGPCPSTNAVRVMRDAGLEVIETLI